MNWLRLIALGSVLTLPLAFGGVGRVGNFSIGSYEEGFRVDYPPFLMANPLSNKTLFLRSRLPWSARGGSLQSMNIHVALFSRRYPELVDYSRHELREEFLSKGWELFESKDSCMDIFKTELNTVFVWGVGRGFSMVGGENSQGVMDEMQENVSLREGACQWK